MDWVGWVIVGSYLLVAIGSFIVGLLIIKDPRDVPGALRRVTSAPDGGNGGGASITGSGAAPTPDPLDSGQIERVAAAIWARRRGLLPERRVLWGELAELTREQYRADARAALAEMTRRWMSASAQRGSGSP
jgi:hypothetical protein